MATLEFDVAQFRADFPEFADEQQYTDDELQSCWDAATCYVSDEDYGVICGDCRQRALNLMTAHLCKIQDNVNKGKTNAFVSSSTVDKVSVTIVPPPQSSYWDWWLSLTSYGQQLQALLSVRSVGGMYLGGSAERSGFRKVGGRF